MKGVAMTSGSPWKHIVKFALPVFLGQLLQQLYNTVDTIIVGNFSGEDALSAVGTTGTLVYLFLALCIGFASGNGVVVAQHYGAEDEEKVRYDASSGILFLGLLGVIFSILGAVLVVPAARGLLHVPEEILGQAVLYFRIYSIGIVFQYLYNSIAAILRAVGDSKSTLYFLFVSSIINVILDLLFVAVFKWGVAGAAIATVAAQLGSLIAAYVYMQKKYPIFRFRLKEYVWKHEAVRKTVLIGAPISLQLIIVSFGMTFIQRAVNEFGKAMTASFTVGMRMEQYINLPAMAMQTTLATYTGQNIGAGKIDRVKKGAFQAMVITMTFTVIICALVFVFSSGIVKAFGLSAQAAEYCIAHLRGVAIVNIIFTLYFPIFGMFQGAGHSLVPTVVACFALGIRVASVYILRFTPVFGYSIIWWNGLFGFTIALVISWAYFFSGRWKTARGQKPIKE